MSKSSQHFPGANAAFLPTQWSAVRLALAADEDQPGARMALGALCESYWYPIYAWVRRAGQSAQDAEDLTQGFFARLIEKNLFAAADREKGRLRTFLLTCVKRYMADEHDRAMAKKRGAGMVANFTSEWAEEQFAKEPVDDMTPDRLYQRRWAFTVLEFTMQVLEQRYAAEGNSELFTALCPFLGFSNKSGESYEAVASRLGLKLNTLKSHVRRLRESWREILLSQVACTLEDPTSENIKAELSELQGWI